MFKTDQISSIPHAYRQLVSSHPDVLTYDERFKLRKQLVRYDTPTLMRSLSIVGIVLDEIGLHKASVVSILLTDEVNAGRMTLDDIERHFGKAASEIVSGLMRVSSLYMRGAGVLETENFRKLLLSMAQDVRVILIMLATRLHDMRAQQNADDTPQRRDLARETAFLYAPLAHRLGLYAVKTEFEDLSLKFINREVYSEIAHKLNETKQQRDAYIDNFIRPLRERIESAGFNTFTIKTIKGRTKSIHSIYHKMLKQNTTFENIYDLFAIRIIIDSAPELEKAACWQVFSVVTDMYHSNPKRLRDWLTVPKSNGYESLHTTVLGPEGKWVEVQIRSARMDEVAEKGVAAHWIYKGGKQEQGVDDFMKNIREMLENKSANAAELMDEFRLNMYDREVFVFTPDGDLHRLPKGATVLDFAFRIHSNLGTHCQGARVNGRNVPIRYELRNSDQVEIITNAHQQPNEAWLHYVVTSKAKNKIRQALKDIEYKNAEIGREMLLRKFKNWKLDIDDGQLSNLSRRMGYKAVNGFYQDIALSRLNMLDVRDQFIRSEQQSTPAEVISAEAFVSPTTNEDTTSSDDVLVIDRNLKRVDYQLAKCCHPIYGDNVFGFVSVGRGIMIHRTDCPNAPQMRERFPYRVVQARWDGKAVGSQYPITLRIIGKDDIGIVTNMTSIINKESGVLLRSISIDSDDGLFQGHLTIMVQDTRQLDNVIKKIMTVKGVKSVERD
ncbi:MAG: bifunctional (p)ppGpp synthetase/guanosine-3',5'-bis(diphosphate) 3'-pyrophosphohydrolase [Paludibacteraceae bacterium]|nr:bifunctional (p)ppGpp synthetase/guanosine-3',5'-bis(diphosphate) 3'-pyrophosphohydrolase [Paludibacteraceae bacterium]